jgi:hypothetical protein
VSVASFNVSKDTRLIEAGASSKVANESIVMGNTETMTSIQKRTLPTSKKVKERLKIRGAKKIKKERTVQILYCRFNKTTENLSPNRHQTNQTP